MARSMGSLESDVVALAHQLATYGAGEEAQVYRMSWWSERMLDWAMSHPSFRTQLFRFVDVFPATTDDADVLRHLKEYLDAGDAPKLVDLGVGLADHVPGGGRVSAAVARRNIRRMAQQFIVGTDPDEAVGRLHELWRTGVAATVDVLGEKTVTHDDADRYAGRADDLLGALAAAARDWAPDDHLDADDLGPLPRANLSIKPTALAPSYAPLTRADGLAQARARLRPILEAACDRGAFVYLDMEHYEAKDLTLELFTGLLDEAALSDLHAGVVVQTYLKDSVDDLARIIAWSSFRDIPVTVRLVKGAYWDAETIEARANGWPVPVYEEKTHTDANYERCVRLLHDHHGEVRAAFGSHNLRSLAYAVAYARARGIPDNGYELQLLHGMAEPVQAAVRRLGLRLRLYTPVGELVPGMAYLVRRLLENTSNESFVRARFAEAQDLEALLAPPPPGPLPGPPPPAHRGDTDPDDPGPYEPEPLREWRRADVRAAFQDAVGSVALDAQVPAAIENRELLTDEWLISCDPAEPGVVVARAARCHGADADRAVEVAQRVQPAWAATPPAERAAVLFRAAAWLRARRDAIAALEVREAGKPWADADADVCEAIDFCEYYGREMRRLGVGGVVQSPPGESNRLEYQPKGIVVVISPWNFPLAIPTGMVTAALVTGNAVLFKPAEQTPATAARLVQALQAAGLPAGVLAFLPGVGEEIGAHLVTHPAVHVIAFTGSKAVGLSINEQAARVQPGQRHVKKVIAEMGGKNAMIVDADADLDQAVPAIVSSAFGYSGQKCSAGSRLIVLDDVYDDTVGRVAGATETLRIGLPREMGTQVGPLIDAEAYDRVRQVVAGLRTDARLIVERQDVPEGGYFVGPAIAEHIDLHAPAATDEIFGPVLTVFRVPDMDAAISLANATPYALTAGIFSRTPSHITDAAARLRAGNVYVNRSITGAVVGRQPFGGFGLSGVGSKAGGPDYLLQFLDPRVVTENTLRQGFAPPG